MSFRFSGLCAVLLLTAGCSSLPSLSRLFDSGEAPPAAVEVAAPVAPPPAQNPDWCSRLAANARSQAQAGGFDAATQERMTQQALSQCARMNGQG